MPNKITVVGSINYDTIFQTEDLPRKGETLTATGLEGAFGGKGANQAVAASALGAHVDMIGAVGSDDLGLRLKGNLKARGVGIEGIKMADGASGSALITIDSNGDNTIIVYPGANRQVDESWIHKCRKSIEDADYMMVQLELPPESVAEAVKIAAEAGTSVIFNPAPVKDFPESIYRAGPIITPNETELARLTGETDIEAGSAALLAKGASAVVVTLGSKGCFYRDSERTLTVSGFKVEAVDTTAAGDTFNGALAVALARGDEIEKALRFACAAGAIAVMSLGAQPAIPGSEAVEKFLAEHEE
jgi:ribokinase